MKRIKLFLIASLTMFAIFTQVQPVKAFAAAANYYVYEHFKCKGSIVGIAMDANHVWDVAWQVRGKSWRKAGSTECHNTNWAF
jgi:hypothetical protein